MTSIQAIDDEDDETYEDDEYQPLLYSNEKKSFLAVPGQPGGPLASASASSLTQQYVLECMHSVVFFSMQNYFKFAYFYQFSFLLTGIL